MAPGPVDALWLVAYVLLYLLLGAVAILVTLGIPAYVGRLVYDRARTEELTNPVAIGFGAGFFAALILLFVLGTLLVWVG